VGRVDAEAGAILAQLELGSQVVDWCLRSAGRAERRGHLEAAVQWATIAAWVGERAPFPYLCSPGLEGLTTRLSARVPRVARLRPGRQKRRWLHVLSVTYAIGGHTALLRRWIQRNPHGDRHDVVLTGQPIEQLEPRLRSAVAASGGQAVSIVTERSLFGRANLLRDAGASADVAVLHIDPWDVSPSIAFGQGGGPPILLLNHADHAFWAGSGSIDLVVDIRTSGQHLTRKYRGAPESVELPVPLEDNGEAPNDRTNVAHRLRFGAGAGTGPLLLTIGRAEKYVPNSKLDFIDAAERILTNLPEARLVAVGPSEDDPRWQSLATRTKGRALAVGEDAELAHWHAAADVYLEGFPIGSYTALLETALAGRPVVRKPLLVPSDVLPVDQGALAGITAPVDPSDYVRAALDLATDVDGRQRQASENRHSMLRHHCGAAWDQRLTELAERLPREHDPAVRSDVPPIPFELAAYWTRYRASRGSRDAFMVAFLAGLERGLHPRVDAAMYRALTAGREAGALSVGPAKALIGSWGLSALPGPVAEGLYRILP
jgi:glycosyltransferase involved in cell wall biosynthesis